MRAKEIQFQSDGVDLVGEFAAPDTEATYPTALILAGSGPLDRDGNHRRLALNVSRDLAAMADALGWASLRFDKRGIGESGGDYLSTGFYDELADAEAALAWLRQQPNVGPIVIIGHSVGAIYAGEMVSRDPDLAGAVLLATSVKTGGDTLVWQAAQMQDVIVPAPVKLLLRLFRTGVVEQQSKALAKLRATTTDVARIQMVKVNARWMREFIEHDPKPSLFQAKVPLLAITGDKDVQVDVADLNVVAATAPDATVHAVSDVDHTLRYEAAEVSNPRKYKKQIERPIDSRVTARVEAFLSSISV